MRSSPFSSSPNEVAARRAWLASNTQPGFALCPIADALHKVPYPSCRRKDTQPLTSCNVVPGVWRRGRYVGGVGSRLQFIAAACFETTAIGRRRLRRIDVFGRTDLAWAGL